MDEDQVTQDEAAHRLNEIRALVNTADDGPEGPMGLGQVRAILEQRAARAIWEEALAVMLADAQALEGLREAVRGIEQAFGSRGCGNLPCYFRVARSPGGQHTNGHCSCLETLHDGHSGRMKARALVRLFQAVKAAVKATE